MLWSEIKRWAKEQGYETIKDKGDEKKGDLVQYYWSKIDSAEHSGVARSVSKLAKAIFNDITENKWIEHQEQHKFNMDISNVKTE